MDDLQVAKPISKQAQRSRLTSRNSRRSSISEELIEEFKNIIQDRSRRQILLLCTDLKDKQRSKHVIDSAVALENQGHKVTIVTTAFQQNLYSENLSKIIIYECGKWIPASIRGYFSNFLYFLRSLYSTLYMIFSFRELQPKVSVVFCETSYLMIPIIKWWTQYKVVYFQYQFELAQFRIPASEISFKGNWIFNLCLRRVDHVLVPNQVFYNIYKRSFKYVTPTICQPYLNVRQLKKEKLLPLNQVLEDVSNDSLIFLLLAEYHPRSNLELALDAFHLFLHTSEHNDHSRVRLVIAGHAGRGRTRYVRQLATRVRRLHLDSRVLLHPRPSRQHKKALLAGCVALLSCQEQGLWDRYVLEAMAMGRPVIAADTGFTEEVLENGVTGYVIPAKPDSFSAAMAEVIYNVGKGEFIGKMAHCEFIKKYSIEAYGERLNQILVDFFETEKNKMKHNEINLENSELFFG